jgi:alpha-galactosidase
MSSSVQIARVDREIDINELDDEAWQEPEPVKASRCWSGEEAPESRHFVARLLWSAASLYVRFEARQHEPLIVSDHPDPTQKTLGLWDRDVCEIFIAPDPSRRERYFEFEVAPTGEWVDLALEIDAGERKMDTSYSSGMRTAASVRGDKVVMAIAIPWSAFGTVPRKGDIWAGNLFRCVGAGPERGYLAWQPTLTEKPNFHVPERFGQLIFVG